MIALLCVLSLFNMWHALPQKRKHSDFFIRNCDPDLHGRVLIIDARIQLAMSMFMAVNLPSWAIFIRILGRKKNKY